MFNAYGDTFEDKVLRAPGLTLVVFHSEWGYDGRATTQWRQYKTALREFEEIVPKGVRIAVVDFDSELELADDYEVVQLPLALVFRNGREVDRLIGVQSSLSLCRRLLPFMGPSGLAMMVRGILHQIKG